MKRTSTIDTTDSFSITIRMPNETKQKIEQLARKEKRSFNSQAVLLLQEILELMQPAEQRSTGD